MTTVSWEVALRLLSIRPARADEAELIRSMVREARIDPTQLRWQNFVVAERDGRVVGIGQLRRYGAVQELGSLVVVPALRRQGIGGALIDALVARRDGALYLECEASLAPIYTAHGFRPVPWYTVPWPLKAKFGLSFILSRLVLQRVVAMRYDEG